MRDKHDFTEHEKCDGHQAAVKAGRKTTMRECIERAAKVTGVVAGQRAILLAIVLNMVLYHLPSRALPAFTSVLDIAGVPGFDHSYNHHRYFSSGLLSISEVLLSDQLQDIQRSPWYSLLADSSSDVSGEDHMLVYCRYLDPGNCTPVTRYLCTVYMPVKTGEATHLTLIAVMESLGLDPAKLVEFCSDGDSSFTGCNAGVTARFKRRLVKEGEVVYAMPWLVAVHCCAHKTALVAGDVAKGCPELKAIDSLLREVHGLFSHSSGKLQHWKRYALANNITCTVFPCFVVTRWFSRGACIKTLTDNWSVLVVYLSRYEAAVAEKTADTWKVGSNVLAKLKDRKLMSLLFSLRDLMVPLDGLSKKFQATDALLPHKVKGLVDAAIDSLKASKTEQGSHFTKWNAQINQAYVWASGSKYPIQLTRSDVAFDPVAFAVKFVDACLKGLEKRFAEKDLLHDFHIFDPVTYRNMDSKNVKKFGRAPLKRLLDRFCGKGSLFPVRPEAVEGIIDQEFLKLKQKMVALMSSKESKGVTMSSVWSDICYDHALVFPHLIKLVHVSFCIPVETACVERGFSLHRVTKDRLRNRLMIATVDALLRVKFLGSVAAFDFQSATVHLRKQDSERIAANMFLAVNQIVIPGFDAGFDVEDDFTMEFDDEGVIFDDGTPDFVVVVAAPENVVPAGPIEDEDEDDVLADMSMYE